MQSSLIKIISKYMLTPASDITSYKNLLFLDQETKNYDLVE